VPTPAWSAERTITGTATSHTITLPASGVNAGQLITIWCSTQESADAGAPATPAGYTQRWSLGHASSFRPRITCVYKIADGSEDSDVVTFTWGTSVETHIVAVGWDDVDTTTPFDTTRTGPTNGSSNPDPASITTVTPNAVVLGVIAGNRSPTPSVTLSSGFSTVYSQVPDARAFVIESIVKATPGAVNPSALTWTPIDNHTTVTDALRPASGVDLDVTGSGGVVVGGEATVALTGGVLSVTGSGGVVVGGEAIVLPTLPETDLDTTHDDDHIDHHGLIHAIANRLLDATGAGDALTKTAATETLASLTAIQPHYVLSAQTLDHAHTVAGAVGVTITAATRVVRVTASANITGLTITGHDLIGLTHSELRILIEATASINVDLSGVDHIIGTVPATMVNGDRFSLRLQRWETPLTPLAVAATKTSTSDTPTTAHQVRMPDVVTAGQTLLAFLAANSDTTFTRTGWTQLAHLTGEPGTLDVWRKTGDATGTEGGTDVVFTSAAPFTALQPAAFITATVDGHHGDITVATASPAISNQPDPPPVTAAWGSAQNLFMAVHARRNANSLVTAYPAGYTGGVDARRVNSGGGAVGIGLAHRLVIAATENPGPFTVSASERWLAATLALRPA
jgi:hypothetical protein